MSGTETPNPQTAFLLDSTNLVCPSNKQSLLGRMRQLQESRLVTFADRAEMLGIWQLVVVGKVTAGELRKALLRFYNYAPLSLDGDWLQPVRDDQAKVWRRLTLLVNGQDPSQDVDEDILAEREDGQLSDWLREVMSTLKILTSAPGGPNPYQVINMLPEVFADEIRSRAAFEWFGSPYAIGESLEALPTNGGGGFGPGDQGVHMVDALAVVVLWAIDNLPASDPSTEEARIALGWVQLWWMLLKGFAYSLLHNKSGKNMPAALIGYPQAVERISLALINGFQVITEREAAGTRIIPQWRGSDEAASGQAGTLELVEQLRERVAHEAERMEQLRNVR